MTPESAIRFSRLHPRCGTTFLLFVMSIAILLHTVLVPLLLVLVWTPDSAVANIFLLSSSSCCCLWFPSVPCPMSLSAAARVWATGSGAHPPRRACFYSF